MAVSDQKLSEIEDALAELGKSDDEVSEVLGRFVDGGTTDLEAVDHELEALGEGATIDHLKVEGVAIDVDQAADLEEWDNDKTEVEVINPADDFVLLVDEEDLEELEAGAEDVPRVTVPPPLPGQQASDEGDAGDEDEDDEGFFKKLFGSRRSSNRP